LHPRNVVHEGEQVRVRVLRVDPANHRLGLSLRQAHNTNPSS
jgi:ribosomal protein S1